MRFFTSDTHFGHKNIIEYCQRPFKTVDEMNQVLIDNWNAVVKPEDTIYHLGDVAFLKQEAAYKIIQQLNGNKILIRGNHDKGAGAMNAMGFPEVHDKLQIEINGQKLWLSHYPYPFIEYDPYIEDHDDPDAHHTVVKDVGQPKDDFHTWLLCGHVHTAWKSKQFKGRKNGMLNVGVDQWGFKPISEIEIADTIRQLRSAS